MHVYPKTMISAITCREGRSLVKGREKGNRQGRERKNMSEGVLGRGTFGRVKFGRVK